MGNVLHGKCLEIASVPVLWIRNMLFCSFSTSELPATYFPFRDKWESGVLMEGITSPSSPWLCPQWVWYSNCRLLPGLSCLLPLLPWPTLLVSLAYLQLLPLPILSETLEELLSAAARPTTSPNAPIANMSRSMQPVLLGLPWLLSTVATARGGRFVFCACMDKKKCWGNLTPPPYIF